MRAAMSSARISGPAWSERPEAGLSLSPKPRKSGAIRRYRSARRSNIGSQAAQNSGQPCSRINGGPLPVEAACVVNPRVSRKVCFTSGMGKLGKIWEETMTSSAILYETPTPAIARIVLNRADTRNAQDTAFLYALNDAFDRAA